MPDSTIEIITGREGRRRWGVEEKLRIFAETHEPGTTVGAVAARHDVYPSLLRTWRRQVRDGHLVTAQARHFVHRMCRQAFKVVDEKWHGGDPRKAMAYHVAREIQAFHRGVAPKNILEECFTAIVASFVAEFMPPGSSLIMNGQKPKRPLGLLLTRETANLLSNANPLDIDDSLWRTELDDRAIYVGVPHGAILMEGGGSMDDVIELRAILAVPFLPSNAPGQTLFVAQMTKRASDEGRGRIGGVGNGPSATPRGDPEPVSPR